MGAKNALGSPSVYAAAVTACIALESITIFDIFFQLPFFHNSKWVISKAFHQEWKALFYTAPKVIIGILGGTCLLVFLLALIYKRKGNRFNAWKKPALQVTICIALIPLCVSALKAVTGVYSPVDLLPYGGNFPHIGLVEQLWKYGHVAGGRSFPAGHASGGFALMSLYYLPVGNALKKILFIMGVLAGWLMGLYQMGRGEHFMSHTLASMFIALLIITSSEKILRRISRKDVTHYTLLHPFNLLLP